MAERTMLCESCYLMPAKFAVASSQKKYRDIPESWAALDPLPTARVGSSSPPSSVHASASPTVQALELPKPAPSKLPSDSPKPGSTISNPWSCRKPPTATEPIANMEEQVRVRMHTPCYYESEGGDGFIGHTSNITHSSPLGNETLGLHTPVTCSPYKPLQLVYCPGSEKGMSSIGNSAALVIGIAEIDKDLCDYLERAPIAGREVTKTNASHWKVYLTLMQYDFDLESHRLVQRQVRLRVDSARKIGALRAIPFEYMSRSKLRDLCLDGQKFWQLCRGAHYIKYSDKSVDGSMEFSNKPGRFMVDMMGYVATNHTHRGWPAHKGSPGPLVSLRCLDIPGWRRQLSHKLDTPGWPHRISLTANQLGNAAFLVPTVLPAFDLSRTKTWVWIFLNHVEPVDYRITALENDIILPWTLRNSITSVAHAWKAWNILTPTELCDEVDKDDIKRFTLHFHGPEGSGKTMTALHLAEHIGFPYFQMGPEDFVHPEVLNSMIDQILRLGHQWRSVLILDNMDHLVQRRKRSSDEWRMIERVKYLLNSHRGLKILTTRDDPENLIYPIVDTAGHHFAFPKLPRDGRMLAWKRGLKSRGAAHGIVLRAANGLADHDLNGKEINKVVKEVRLSLRRNPYKSDWDEYVVDWDEFILDLNYEAMNTVLGRMDIV